MSEEDGCRGGSAHEGNDAVAAGLIADSGSRPPSGGAEPMGDERLAEIRRMMPTMMFRSHLHREAFTELLAEVTRLRSSAALGEALRDGSLIEEANLRGAWKWSWSQPDWATLSPEDHFGRAIRAAGTRAASLASHQREGRA